MGDEDNLLPQRSEVFVMSKNVGEKLRDFGRELMNDPSVKGVKLIAFRVDGRYEEYNNNFDTMFKKEEEE